MPNIFGRRMTRSRVAESFGLGTSLYNKALLQKCSVYQNARDTKMLDYQKAQIQKMLNVPKCSITKMHDFACLSIGGFVHKYGGTGRCCVAVRIPDKSG